MIQKNKTLILNTIFILYTYILIINLLSQNSYPHEYESWQISEWLINFQGGYVRRGLIGEILYFFAQHFNFNIVVTIKIFSFLCLIGLLGFFIKHFLQKGYALYILPTCLFFGTHITNGMYWTKRDYLILLLFIFSLFALKKFKNLLVYFTVVNIIMVLAIHVHEAVALFTLPILILILRVRFIKFNYIRSIIYSILLISPTIISFFIVVKYHGDMIVAQKIWDSWTNVIGSTPAKLDHWSHGVISSLGWSSEMAFEFHRNKNFWSKSGGILSLPFWILITPVIYFIASNYLYVFSHQKSSFTIKSRTLFSSILMVQFICIIPFFLFLSCDLGRIIFYWMTSSFIIFLMVPENELELIFPKSFMKTIQKLNNTIDSLVQPSKSVIALLIIVIGIPTAGFSIDFIFESSVIGNILIFISKYLS